MNGSSHGTRVQAAKNWKVLLDRVQIAIRYAAGEDVSERVDDPDRLWEGDQEIRDTVRPVLTDTAETAQFLAAMHLTLTPAAQALFVDCLYSHLAAALRRLLQQRGGDFSPDGYVKRFPTATTPDAGLTPWQLYERWAAEKQPAAGTLENWRGFFRAMEDHFGKRSAGSIQPEEANAWIRGLVSPKRTARTVQLTWLRACKAIFNWAVHEAKLINSNPFAGVKIKGKAPKLKRQKAFHEGEQRTILMAASAIKDTSNPDDAVMRWAPWLQAYSGARAAEITQLRGDDVREIDGIWCIRITPEAGTVKSREARLVPLHEHIIEQGFLTFVAEKGGGPLFYRERSNRRRRRDGGNGIVTKSPAAQARQRLSERIGALGVPGRSEGLSRNHAWRHTFKQIAERCGISERISDQITGHSPATTARSYGRATVADMAEALKKFPRYDVC